MADVPKTLADGHTLLMLLAAKPADMKAPTVAEITAGKDISCRITKADFRLSATASETVDGTALCDEATVNVFGASNFEGTIAPFRYFNPEQPGQHDTEGDFAFQAFKEKGVTLYLVVRSTGKKYDAPIAAGDEVSVFEVIPDNWQAPSESGGFQRRVVPLSITKAELNAVVAA